MSLRAQVSWVIALLAALPNLVLMGAVILPTIRTAGAGPDTVRFLVLWFALVVVGSILVSIVLARQLLAPLERLQRDVQALQVTAPSLGRVRLAARPKEPREVSSLRTTFNALLTRVQTEQSRRSSFVAALVHDLKTPLIAARHLLDVVRDQESLTREQRIDVVSRLSREHESLIELVQKMIDAHRLESEDLVLQRHTVQLEEVVTGVVERLAPLARERGVRIGVTGRGAAEADDAELERALYNLLGNAVRYAAAAIDVEVFPGLVRIRDDGPGLPAPLEELAQPFRGQAMEIAGKRYTAGAGGLGLFIARRVLEAHGGRLVAEATGPHGTVLLAYVGTRRGSSGPA